ncbi:osmotically inducible lipoprotein OsmB [Desulfovibrionales bacterium]
MMPLIIWEKIIPTTMAGVLLVLAVSCADINRAQQIGSVGTLAGAAIGGAASRTWTGALVGASIGLGLGYIIGNEWDKSDQKRLSQTLEYNRSGQANSWSNPDTGCTYMVTPSLGYNQDGRVYRDVTLEANVDGRREVVHAKACRDQHGEWRLVQ